MSLLSRRGLLQFLALLPGLARVGGRAVTSPQVGPEDLVATLTRAAQAWLDTRHDRPGPSLTEFQRTVDMAVSREWGRLLEAEGILIMPRQLRAYGEARARLCARHHDRVVASRIVGSKFVYDVDDCTPLRVEEKFARAVAGTLPVLLEEIRRGEGRPLAADPAVVWLQVAAYMIEFFVYTAVWREEP